MPGIAPEDVTLVIPAHDIAAYLPACLASIREHGGAGSPIIVVDDGSRDGTPELRAGLEADGAGRLSWRRIPHSGPRAARNIGLAAVTTPWVSFVDGDDVLVQDGLHHLCAAAEPGVDIVFSNKMIAWQIPPRIETLSEFTDRRAVPIREIPCEKRLSCHGKLFRTAFLHQADITFPEGMVWEDIVFSHRSYRHAGRVSSIAAVTYFWQKRPPGVGSVTQRPLLPAAIRDRVRQVEMSVAISETPEWRANFGQSFRLGATLRRRLSPVFRAMRQPGIDQAALAALAVIRDACQPHWALLAAEPEPVPRIFDHVRALDLASLRALPE